MRKIIVSEESKALLKEVCQKSASPIFKQRAECILLASNLGLIAPQLAKHFEVRTKTIYHWFNLWEEGGLAGLKHKQGQGCKKKLNAISQEDLKSLLAANSQNLKEVLSILSSKYKIEVSKRTLIRFLKR
jgi:transposase